MDVDLSRYRSYDSETKRFAPGYMAPEIVCASTARLVGAKFEGELHAGVEAAVAAFQALVDAGYTVAYANGAYDLAVIAQTRPGLLAAIFRALAEKRVHDILVSESLNAIYYGHLNTMPDGRELVNPSTGKVTNRYSLPLVVQLVLGRANAKENDTWRESYALLAGIPPVRWPEDARQYPVDDSINTLDAAIGQILGAPGDHSWVDDAAGGTVCKHCNESLGFSACSPRCTKAPRKPPHKNAQNLAAQVEADFALHLGSCWSLRVDGERVEKLAAKVEAQHAKAVARYQKKGWIRANGTENESAVKRSIAKAYGASEPCPRCGGAKVCSKCGGTGKGVRTDTCRVCDGSGQLIGKIRKIEVVECRGTKENGRYRGCLGPICLVCRGTRTVEQLGNEVVCQVVPYDGPDTSSNRPTIWGCDGTGYDLAPLGATLPRADKLGVKTDRDTKMESGDEDLADYGEDEFEKSRSTYVPYLRKGVTQPLLYRANVIVATGRCSVEQSPLHQMPRMGGERECVRARGAWCGSPIEYVLGSTDYEAGELCTLSQLTYWLFGYSKMRDAINASGKPGILHSDLAAEVLGISLEEFLKRLKAKDRQAVDFRQMCKPINFGKPGRMGNAKLVLTSRKKNAGFTVCERGPAENAKGEPGYWGVRFCILTGGAKECGIKKITEWKKYPCAPVCEACVKVVANELSPAYFRRYPEINDYFRWAKKYMDEGRPAPCAVWDANEGAPVIIRERHCDEITAFCNNGFQGMLADIGKHAFVRATRECYLGVKEDGSPSPLAGCRLPLYLHDEPLSELIRDTAHLSGPRIGEIMEESGRTLAPDLTWVAKTALMSFWYKSADPVYDAEGKLTVWEPEAKAA